MPRRPWTSYWRITAAFCGLLAATTLAYAADAAVERHPLAQPSVPADERLQKLEDYGRLPLSFEPGLDHAGANFVSRGPGYTVLLAPGEAILHLAKRGKQSSPTREERAAGTVLRMKLIGAHPDAPARGMNPQPGLDNYFLGNDPATWRTNVATFQRVQYSAVYDGIDLVYYGNQRQLEYDFVIAPGANPGSIALEFEGAVPTIDSHGDLVLGSGSEGVTFRKPQVYQQKNGGRDQIDGSYAVTAGNRVRFVVGAYDRTLPLVIDPVLGYSTLLGGTYEDQAVAIAIDKSGNAYVTGYTCSADFPATDGAFQTVDAGGAGPNCGSAFRDVFVSKLNASGTGLIYSTYLGGSDYDNAAGIAVDSAGNAYVAGGTTSTDFPTTAGAMQRVCAPENIWNHSTCTLANIETTCSAPAYNYNGFVTKLDPTGSTLVYSTYIGGTGNDQLHAIAVDSLGDAYVAGHATSKAYADINCIVDGAYAPVNYPYPTTGSGYEGIGQTQYQSPTSDTFYWTFSKLAADGSALVYSSDLYGGVNPPSTINSAGAIAIDAGGNAYVTGYAYDGTFPATSGAFQTACGSCPTYPDAFVAKFNPSQSGAASLAYGTYLGGNGGDAGFAIAADAAGNAYVAGATGEVFGGNDPASTNFPTSKKAFQGACPGTCAPSGNGFVTKLNPAGSSLIYSTYFGGGTPDNRTEIYGLALGPGGKAFVTGFTNDPAFPTQNPLQSGVGSLGDAFVAEFNASAAALVFSSPIGGSGPDSGGGIAVDAKGNAYVAGGTGSTSGAQPYFPTSFGAFQTGCGDLGTCDGYYDGFVLKLLAVNAAADLAITNVPSPSPVPSGTNLTFTLTTTNLGPSTATSVKVTDAVPAGTTFVSVTTSTGSCSAPPVGGKGTVTCSGFDLSAGSSTTVTMVVLVTAKTGKTVKDTAKAASAVSDPNTANNSVTVTVPVS